jgi:hypothetical protein
MTKRRRCRTELSRREIERLKRQVFERMASMGGRGLLPMDNGPPPSERRIPPHRISKPGHA